MHSTSMIPNAWPNYLPGWAETLIEAHNRLNNSHEFPHACPAMGPTRLALAECLRETEEAVVKWNTAWGLHRFIRSLILYGALYRLHRAYMDDTIAGITNIQNNCVPIPHILGPRPGVTVSKERVQDPCDCYNKLLCEGHVREVTTYHQPSNYYFPCGKHCLMPADWMALKYRLKPGYLEWKTKVESRYIHPPRQAQLSQLAINHHPGSQRAQAMNTTTTISLCAAANTTATSSSASAAALLCPLSHLRNLSHTLYFHLIFFPKSLLESRCPSPGRARRLQPVAPSETSSHPLSRLSTFVASSDPTTLYPHPNQKTLIYWLRILFPVHTASSLESELDLRGSDVLQRPR
ncbi:hypothetical protein D9758_007059 [Tetrapyrgos nigripes]|uniref:Uncharacterized protein n=1 Tax=Tetrapyrgos nigripes TaxID=182062 RepID=A0A8H5GDV4_9AGAR|nr:hypothetical protein D9758_007059 [Tetrapyrgos nigripes]